MKECKFANSIVSNDRMVFDTPPVDHEALSPDVVHVHMLDTLPMPAPILPLPTMKKHNRRGQKPPANRPPKRIKVSVADTSFTSSCRKGVDDFRRDLWNWIFFVQHQTPFDAPTGDEKSDWPPFCAYRGASRAPDRALVEWIYVNDIVGWISPQSIKLAKHYSAFDLAKMTFPALVHCSVLLHFARLQEYTAPISTIALREKVWTHLQSVMSVADVNLRGAGLPRVKADLVTIKRLLRVCVHPLIAFFDLKIGRAHV